MRGIPDSFVEIVMKLVYLYQYINRYIYINGNFNNNQYYNDIEKQHNAYIPEGLTEISVCSVYLVFCITNNSVQFTLFPAAILLFVTQFFFYLHI